VGCASGWCCAAAAGRRSFEAACGGAATALPALLLSSPPPHAGHYLPATTCCLPREPRRGRTDGGLEARDEGGDAEREAAPEEVERGQRRSNVGRGVA